MSSEQTEPLNLTLNPRLDQAAAHSAEAWEAAARVAGVSRTAAWLSRRQQDPDARDELANAVALLLEAEAPDDLVFARAELAELIEEQDDLLAETLWESIRAYAMEHDDGETLASATAQLASIAERHGDILAAAEFHLAFLNWRRQPGRVSDAEDVQTSFEEVIRLAELDGERQAAALFAYRQASFTRLAEAEDDRATEGEWENSGARYASWA
ncbi:MAG TPA: hypothetical protein VGR16_00265 [Thermomicrobiales bacterium]|nr:hypothetical protein [Thermomicrobiales bacterium]